MDNLKDWKPNAQFLRQFKFQKRYENFSIYQHVNDYMIGIICLNFFKGQNFICTFSVLVYTGAKLNHLDN